MLLNNLPIVKPHMEAKHKNKENVTTLSVISIATDHDLKM